MKPFNADSGTTLDLTRARLSQEGRRQHAERGPGRLSSAACTTALVISQLLL